MTEQDFDALVAQSYERFDVVTPTRGGLTGLSQIRERAVGRSRRRRRRVISFSAVVAILAVAVPASAATGVLDPLVDAFRRMGVISSSGAPESYVRVGQQALPDSGSVRLYIPGPGTTTKVKASDCVYLEFLAPDGHHQGGSGWCSRGDGIPDLDRTGLVTAIHVPRAAAVTATVSAGQTTAVVTLKGGYGLLPVSFPSGTVVVTARSVAGKVVGTWTVDGS